MNIYNNGKIYKLVNSFGTTYVGSTTQTLAQRKAKHTSCFKSHLKGNESTKITSIKLFVEDPDNVDIVLLELVNCNSKMELHQRERHYVEKLYCVNKYIPTRTEKEYKIENFDKISAQQKEYRSENKETIRVKYKDYCNKNFDKISAQHKEYNLKNKEINSARKKEYRSKNIDRISANDKEYNLKNKEIISAQQKEYRSKNIDKINANKKEYRSENIEKIKANASVPHLCECGCTIRHGEISRHKKTSKHIKLMEANKIATE